MICSARSRRVSGSCIVIVVIGASLLWYTELYYRRRIAAEKLLDHPPMQLERDLRVRVAHDALAGLVAGLERRQFGQRAPAGQPKDQHHPLRRAKHTEVVNLLRVDRDPGLLQNLTRAGLLPGLA